MDFEAVPSGSGAALWRLATRKLAGAAPTRGLLRRVPEGGGAPLLKSSAPPGLKAASDPDLDAVRVATERISKNLLYQIPAEASGFYLAGAAMFATRSGRDLVLLSLLSLAVLVVVRLAARSSIKLILVSGVAFVLWMATIDNGSIRVMWPNFIPPPWGTILVSFYTVIATVLASSAGPKPAAE